MSVRSIARLISLASATMLIAQAQDLPAAPGAAVVTISPPGRFSEPGVAVNPKNPDQIVAVYQVGAYAAYSRDAGRSFTAAQGTKPTDWRVAGDVSTTFDNKGNAYLCYLAFDRLGTVDYWAHNAGRNGIFVRKSSDGGRTWAENAVAVKVFPTGHERGLAFEDEPRIFADTGVHSRYAGNLYAGWVEWQLDKSVMLFSRSVDAGGTWSSPIQISVHPGLPRDDNGSLGGFAAAVARDGTLYAIWDDGNSILLTESSDGGVSFSPPVPVMTVAPPYFSEVPEISRVEGFPQIGVDTSRDSGNLYVTWSDYRNGDIDVFISVSRDAGRHWSAPARVNNDPIHDGADQFYQWMAVDPMNGDVYVQFYDRRGDPAGLKTRFTLARSTDSGHTFTNYLWQTSPFEAHGAFLGDYTWLAAYDGHVYGAWTETARATSSGAAPGRPVSTVVRVGRADFSRAH